MGGGGKRSVIRTIKASVGCLHLCVREGPIISPNEGSGRSHILPTLQAHRCSGGPGGGGTLPLIEK